MHVAHANPGVLAATARGRPYGSGVAARISKSSSPTTCVSGRHPSARSMGTTTPSRPLPNVPASEGFAELPFALSDLSRHPSLFSRAIARRTDPLPWGCTSSNEFPRHDAVVDCRTAAIHSPCASSVAASAAIPPRRLASVARIGNATYIDSVKTPPTIRPGSRFTTWTPSLSRRCRISDNVRANGSALLLPRGIVTSALVASRQLRVAFCGFNSTETTLRVHNSRKRR